MKNWYFIIALFVGCLASVGAFAALSWSRAPTPFETVLFQVVILITGLLGSYIYGKNSAAEAARDVIKPQARSAFRRLFSMNRNLKSISAIISGMRRDKPDQRLDTIQFLVDAQIWTGQDSLADWSDIIPEYMKEIERGQAQNDNES